MLIPALGGGSRELAHYRSKIDTTILLVCLPLLQFNGPPCSPAGALEQRSSIMWSTFSSELIQQRKSQLERMSGRWSSVILRARLDVSIWIEGWLETPPAAFENFKILNLWANEYGLRVRALKYDNLRNPVMVQIYGDWTIPLDGFFQSCPYSQIWTLSNFSGYREPFAEFHCTNDDIDFKGLTGLHADHVINRARLRSLPDSWVLLFPVDRKSNIGHGAKVEKRLKPIEKIDEVMYLDSVSLFKIFSNDFPKTTTDLDRALENFEGQILSNRCTVRLVEQWKNEIRSVFE
jgi:hypothetical protein